MDASEIVKHGSELIGAAAALGGTLKFTDIIKTMLGPAAAEIAERFRDDVRVYRYGRQLACLQKAEQMAKDAGFTPRAVPIKLLFPLLEGASLEEDELLHTMWAALLTNAASPENSRTVRPGYIAVLKQMSPDEGALLNWIYDHHRSQPDFPPSLFSFEALEDNLLVNAYYTLGFGPQGDSPAPEDALRGVAEYLICLNSIKAAGFIRDSVRDDGTYHELTTSGYAFVLACQPPTRLATT